MTRALSAVAVVCALALSIVAANATPRHHAHKPHQRVIADSASPKGCVLTNEGRQICGGAIQRASESRNGSVPYDRGGVIGGRPPGCPRAFCGCEASRYVFGRMIPDLYLAANWIRKFPRTAPAPGMAAARSGHVFVLISHISGADWLVHDGNSGGGKTRVHERSIAGYVIVNPHASRMAMR
ncbi:MAG: hypothetical protein JWN58_1007 [Gammaproteobacteria bacterium]|nr:hypothetical protein [Gammaproteobacteria bacterium]